MTNALTLMPAKLLATAQINGKPVSFFSPPHLEPDFLWVDVQELAAAFCTKEETVMLTDASQLYDLNGKRPAATAINGDRIATIVCHTMAQGLCGAIDHMNGADDDRPAFEAYCKTSANVGLEHWRLDFQEMLEAYSNVGGPFMRSGA